MQAEFLVSEVHDLTATTATLFFEIDPNDPRAIPFLHVECRKYPIWPPQKGDIVMLQMPEVLSARRPE